MGDKPWWRDPRGMLPGLRTLSESSDGGDLRAERRRGRGGLVLVSFVVVLVARIVLAMAGVSSGYAWLFTSIGLSAIALMALAIAAFRPRRA